MVRIVQANGKDEYALLDAIRDRAGEVDREVTRSVSEILEDVRQNGDNAVRKYTEKFDGTCPERFEVGRDTLEKALDAADPAFLSALENAKRNIEDFHRRQVIQSFIDIRADGVILGQRIRGLSRVGLYVPGGTAAYPSSVLMNAIPAKIAGVERLVMATPPAPSGGANPDILAAAALCGVDRVFLMGGAQAVAALAYGTDTVPRVDKIVGPGNIYVATAKRLLYGQVDIDMVAGPSEILILADQSADPRYLAADMLSQAEHDELASAMLIVPEQVLAEETARELRRQTDRLPRASIIEKSLANYGAIIVCPEIERMVELANRIAPEHLEVMLENPISYLGRLRNAGSIFLGAYSPEPLGDYYAGPNHVLPTGGAARFFSPLSVDSFVKRSRFICYTEKALEQAAPDVARIARREGLDAHANSIEVRLKHEHP
jgi:histidinol dehydrogenase